MIQIFNGNHLYQLVLTGNSGFYSRRKPLMSEEASNRHFANWPWRATCRISAEVCSIDRLIL